MQNKSGAGGRGSVLGHYGIIPLYMLHEAEDLGTIT